MHAVKKDKTSSLIHKCRGFTKLIMTMGQPVSK